MTHNKTVKFATINISKISQASRLTALINFCESQDLADVIGLQEVRFSQVDNITIKYRIHSNLGQGRGGTVLLIKNGIEITGLEKEANGQLIKVNVFGLTIINVYVLAGDGFIAERNLFLSSVIPAYLPSSGNDYLVFGDFNSIEDAKDRETKSKKRKIVNHNLINLVKSSNLVDVWKQKKGDDPGHTLTYKGGSARLDRFYSSNALFQRISEINKLAVNFSEHQCVHVSISVPSQNPIRTSSNRQWKLNTAVLEEEEYKQKIQQFLIYSQLSKGYETDVTIWWEKKAKPGFKKISQDYSKKRAEVLRSTNTFYQECLQELIQEPFTSDEKWFELREMQKKAAAWEENKLRGHAIRARTDWATTEEPATAYHLNREKKRGTDNSINKLLINKESTTDTDTIRQTIEQHFRQQYSARRPTTTTPRHNPFLEAMRGSAIYNEGNLTKAITVEEIYTILLKKKNNKAPGDDGLPYEFYKTFWQHLGPTMARVYNENLNKKKITQSQGHALVRLIPKKRGEKAITDYRPIALLNTDYKLIASVLTQRLGATFPKTIGHHQRGGIAGRKIDSSLSLFRDIIQDYNDRNGHAAVIGVDLSKAYDLVDREIVWEVLSIMGYPVCFIGWLQALYSIHQMTFLFGRGKTETVEGLIGLRQGCPLSMMLFIVYIEPLL